MKNYIKCILANKVFIFMEIWMAVWISFLYFTSESLDSVGLCIFNVVLYTLYSCAVFKLTITQTYKTYIQAKELLKEKGKEYILENIKPRAYCNKQGYKLAIKEFQKNQERS